MLFTDDDTRFTPSADRHDIDHVDALHACRNDIAIFVDDQDMDVTISIGPAFDGTLLEVGWKVIDGDLFIIHAVHARDKFLT